MPLDTSEIYRAETDFGTEKRVYFNGEATAVGCTRIYARLLIPREKADKLVLFMPAPEQDIHSVDFSSFLNNGWAVLAVDYAGNVFDRMRFTIYPNALSFANYNHDNLYAASSSPQKTCWYVWTAVCLRALTFAESENYKKVAIVGMGLGASNTFRAAALSSFPVCAVSVFSPGFFPFSDDPELMNTSISLNVTGYAPMLKIPFLQLCCSNDSDSSLDSISELIEQCSNKGSLYIMPRANKVFSSNIHNDLMIFLSKHFDGDTENLAPHFDFTISGATNKMYFSVKCADNIEKISLYVSHAITNPTYRNWRAVQLEKVGENEFMGYTEIYHADEPVYSFVTLETSDGFMYGSTVNKKIPSQLKIKPVPIIKKRLIYDSDMGVDDFFSLGFDYIPAIKEGPFNISGISANKGFCTYKLGDIAFRGERDSVLQFLMFSPVNQKVKFSVTDGELFNSYTCEKNISPDTDWTKIMISPSDLKSDEGTLDGWDKAIFLRIDAEEEILISSLLWV